MPDPFEEELRGAFRREAARLPFELEADMVHQRLAREPRFQSILQFGIPVAAGLALVFALLTIFPGPDGELAASPSVPPSAPFGGSGPGAASTPRPSPTATPLPGARNSPAVAVNDGSLYLAGGARSASLTTVYHFDPSEGTWRRLPDLPEFRASAAAVVLPDGAVMLAGGVQGGTSLSTTIVLDAGAEEWRVGPTMPFAQADAAVARLGDSIYLIGGSEPGRESAALEYSAAAATWIEHAPLPMPIRDATAVSVDGSVYVMGGESSDGEPSDAAYRYDVAADTWESVASLPRPTARGAAAEFEGRIWLFGPERQAFILDPAADAWSQAPRYARPGMSWYAAIPLAGRIVVVSGSAGPTGVGVDSIDTSLP